MTESMKSAQTKSYAAGGAGSCQCGGSCGGACGGQCGCGGQCNGNCGSACGSECGGGPLQRPRFFSGQLLTEDDLQLLSDYVAAKQRLHNRSLHGSGVVCGLQVMCHPCGDGKVIVQPGHALDCCGNDILLPCAVELDINQMVNDLRLQRLGKYDCGDPCEQDCEDSPEAIECLERKGRRYCLYVNYCETQDDPVTPYATGEDCGVQRCEPTRIREGYRFELRCPEDDPAPDDLFQRIRACIGDLTRADKAAEDALAVGRYANGQIAVSDAIQAGQVQAFESADQAQLQVGVERLQQLPLDQAAEQEAMQIDEMQLRESLDHYQATAATIMRFDLQSEDEKGRLEGEFSGLAEQLEDARNLIQDAGPALGQTAALRLASARDRIVADTWIQQGMAFTQLEQTNEAAPGGDQLHYAYNQPRSAQLQQQFSHDLNQLRDWLLQRLDAKPLFSDCRLRRDILAIDIPEQHESSNNSEAVARAGRRLLEALLRYLIDCICAALNPPCPPCEDPAVKLACLEVVDCEVERICNLERTFVLSGPAIRYWVPFLRTIGELFEKACCETRIRLPEPQFREPVEQIPGTPTVEMVRQQDYMVTMAPSYRHLEGQPQLPTLFRIADIDETQFRAAINLGGNVGSMGTLVGDIAAPKIKRAGTEVVRQLDETAVRAVLRRPQVRQALVGATDEKVEVLSRRMEEMTIDEEAMTDAVSREMGNKLRNISRAVDRRLTASSLGSTKVVKDLKSALQEQRKLNKALEGRLAKLEKRAE